MARLTLPPRALASCRKHSAVACCALALSAGYGAVLWILAQTDVAAEAFRDSGGRLLLYNAARCLLALYLLSATLCAGAILQRRLFPNASPASLGVAGYIAGTGFLGFASLSLLLFAAGFANLYRYELAVAVSGLLIALCPFQLRDWACCSATEFRQSVRQGSPARTLALLSAGTIFLVAAFALLVFRGLYIGDRDNDVWEHYLHYYQAVVDSAGIWPNDLWIHFFVSKAAGMFFLASLLDNVFAAQLVSWLVMIITAVALYDLVSRSSGNRIAGVCSAAILLAGWCSVSGEAGSFLKHHTVLAGLVTAVFWCCERTRLGILDRSVRRFILWTGGLCSLYLGTYITVSAALVVGALSMLSATALLLARDRSLLFASVTFGAASAAGAAVSLAINYSITGLPLDSPVAIFWHLVDETRFASVWNPLVVEYWFVGPASRSEPMSLLTLLQPVPEWWGHMLRLPYLRECIAFAAIAVLAGTAVSGLSGPSAFLRSLPKRLGLLPPLLAFVVGAIAVAQLFQGSESIYRLYSFCLVLTVLAIGTVVGTMCRATTGSKGTLAQWIVVIFCLVSTATLIRKVPRDWRQSAWNFATARISLSEAIKFSETAFPGRVTAAQITHFRTQTRNESRIMFLTYDAAPAYFLPAPAVVSEPSYAFGQDYATLLYGGSERAREILRGRGIGVFAFNLRNRLFLGLPYSPLFAPDSLRRNFVMAWRDGDLAFLRWREPGDADPVPEDLIGILQAKRTGILPENAPSRWGIELTNALARGVRTRDQDSTYYDWLYEAMRNRTRPSRQ